jgi:hypothetical protein
MTTKGKQSGTAQPWNGRIGSHFVQSIQKLDGSSVIGRTRNVIHIPSDKNTFFCSATNTRIQRGCTHPIPTSCALVKTHDLRRTAAHSISDKILYCGKMSAWAPVAIRAQEFPRHACSRHNHLRWVKIVAQLLTSSCRSVSNSEGCTEGTGEWHAAIEARSPTRPARARLVAIHSHATAAINLIGALPQVTSWPNRSRVSSGATCTHVCKRGTCAHRVCSNAVQQSNINYLIIKPSVIRCHAHCRATTTRVHV